MLWAWEFTIYKGCEGRSRSKRVTKGLTGSSKAPGAALGNVYIDLGINKSKKKKKKGR